MGFEHAVCNVLALLGVALATLVGLVLVRDARQPRQVEHRAAPSHGLLRARALLGPRLGGGARACSGELEHGSLGLGPGRTRVATRRRDRREGRLAARAGAEDGHLTRHALVVQVVHAQVPQNVVEELGRHAACAPCAQDEALAPAGGVPAWRVGHVGCRRAGGARDGEALVGGRRVRGLARARGRRRLREHRAVPRRLRDVRNASKKKVSGPCTPRRRLVCVFLFSKKRGAGRARVADALGRRALRGVLGGKAPYGLLAHVELHLDPLLARALRVRARGEKKKKGNLCILGKKRHNAEWGEPALQQRFLSFTEEALDKRLATPEETST